MSAAPVVVPRVIPLFVNELGSTPSKIRLENIRYFEQNVKQVFKCRVEVEDVMDLLLALFRELKNNNNLGGTAPASSNSTVQTASTTGVVGESLEKCLLILRLLQHLYGSGQTYTPLCFKGLRRLAMKVAELRHPGGDEQGGDQSLLQSGAASQLSPIARSNNNTPSFAADGSPSRSNRHGNLGQSLLSNSLPFDSSSLELDEMLHHDLTRPLAIELLQLWDASGIDVSCFTGSPTTLHCFLPTRLTSNVKVYRDFICCTRRPKLSKTWGSFACVHIKTNIPAKSDIMYRLLVEGYNYGVNAVVLNDVVGYANRKWDDISPGAMAQYGYPEGWDKEMCNDYAPGCTISQYYSADRFLTVRLKAKSMFCVGFSVSGWLVFHGYGNGFPLTAEIFHQDADL
jgi:hypothetical protein